MLDALVLLVVQPAGLLDPRSQMLDFGTHGLRGLFLFSNERCRAIDLTLPRFERGDLRAQGGLQFVQHPLPLAKLSFEAARMVPLILDVREEYNVTHSDITMTVGTAAYRIPSRAVSGTEPSDNAAVV